MVVAGREDHLHPRAGLLRRGLLHLHGLRRPRRDRPRHGDGHRRQRGSRGARRERPGAGRRHARTPGARGPRGRPGDGHGRRRPAAAGPPAGGRRHVHRAGDPVGHLHLHGAGLRRPHPGGLHHPGGHADRPGGGHGPADGPAHGPSPPPTPDDHRDGRRRVRATSAGLVRWPAGTGLQGVDETVSGGELADTGAQAGLGLLLVGGVIAVAGGLFLVRRRRG